jgi:tetratricopeptide (TPR) repeat protein
LVGTISGVVLMILLVIYAARYLAVADRPTVVLGLSWFVGFSLPNMFVRLIAADDSFEYLPHRTYLLYAGFLILLLALLPGAILEFRLRRDRIFLVVLLVLFIIGSAVQQPKYRNAESYWESAIASSPGRSWFHYYLGRYYFKQQDYERFEKYLTTADSLKSYPEFKYHLGMVAYVYRKDYDRAYLLFTEAFSGGFGNPEARANFVKLCLESSSVAFSKGDHKKAISLCEEAMLNDPSNGIAAYNLGIYFVNTGEKQRAAAMWKKAVQLQPDLTEAYRSLALYYHFDAKKADSAAWYVREFNTHGGTGNPISP